jgi:hypothetical protein
MNEQEAIIADNPKKKTFHRKGNNYFIVAKNGKTSRTPFPHPNLRAAEDEAIRLAKEMPSETFYVYAAYFKVSVAKHGVIKTNLRYKKPKEKQ